MTTARDAGAPRDSGWTFRLFGFTVSVPWNALIGIAVVGLLWYPQFAGTGGRATQAVLTVVFALVLMGSVLLHELAHGLAARLFGYPVSGITLWAMGGFTTYRTTTRHGPLREAAIAAAGPVTTLAVAGGAVVAESLVAPGPGRVLLSAVASANLLVGIFNLLPGSPLDGGALLRAAVWGLTGSAERGQVVAGWVGRGVAVLVLLTPLLLAWWYQVPPDLILLVVGVMLAALLWSGASASLRSARAQDELRAMAAAALSRPVAPVPADGWVADVLPLLAEGSQLVAVDRSGLPVGVVIPAAARAVPTERAGGVPLSSVCARLDPGTPTLPAEATARDVLDACQDSGSRFVFVLSPQGPRLVDTDAVFVTEGP